MENKDQLNQNPEEIIVPQEENTGTNQIIADAQNSTIVETNSDTAVEPTVEEQVAESTEVTQIITDAEPKTESVPEEKVAEPEEITQAIPETENAVEPEVTETADPTDHLFDKDEFVMDKPLELELSEMNPVVEIPEEEHLALEETELVTSSESDLDYEAMPREKLVEMLEELVNQEDINGVKTKVALIRVAFLKYSREIAFKQLEIFTAAGGNKEDFVQVNDEIEEKFNGIFGIYREKKSHFNEEQEKIKQLNLEAKLEILEQLRNLINSEETLKHTYDEFKALQDKWRSIGLIPKTEVNTLWQNYHFLVEKFFDKVKINKELKDLDLKKNLELKVELCEKAEELLIESSIMKSFKELQKLHEQWKEVGPVPQDKKDEIWDRFKGATDKINTRRRDYYEKLHQDLQGNYDSKLALVEKAKEVVAGNAVSIREWQDKTNNVNELFKLWRSIGPAPRKVNDEVWAQFKACLDSFFVTKSDYFNKIKDQQVNNYNLKFDLCLQAESLMNSTDWKNTTRDLINLQKDWKEIGPVPRKHSDKIWKRFRAACDSFFNNKDTFFSSIHERESENLASKIELIKLVEEYPYTGDKSENLKVIKDFQRKWMEIGHVPIKEKERLQNEFRKVVDKQLDRLNISSVEVNSSNFRARVETFKETPDAGRTLYREVNFLQGKIAKMNEDIALWENNMGFLAESKNAKLLKDEFDKKIQKSKQEIKLMEAKIKMMKDEMNK